MTLNQEEQAALDAANAKVRHGMPAFAIATPGDELDSIWCRLVAKGAAHLTAPAGSPGMPYNYYLVGSKPAPVDPVSADQLAELLDGEKRPS